MITKESKIKVKLEYGNPMISRLEYDGEKLYVEVLIPGVVDKAMVVVADYSKIMIEHEVDGRFIAKFKFFIETPEYLLLNVICKKENGVFFLESDVLEAISGSPKTIIV